MAFARGPGHPDFPDDRCGGIEQLLDPRSPLFPPAPAGVPAAARLPVCRPASGFEPPLP